MAYISKRQGAEVDALLDKVEKGDFDITIDTELSKESNNAIANSAVVNGLAELAEGVSFVIGQVSESFNTELENKADTDGSYPDMTVGKAENLVGRGEATEEYINFRQSAGNVSIEDGSAKITKIKGNSVVYNQQINNHFTGSGATGWAAKQKNFAREEEGKIVLSRNSQVDIFNNALYQNVEVKNGDKFFISYRYESHNVDQYGRRMFIVFTSKGSMRDGSITDVINARGGGVTGFVSEIGTVNNSNNDITRLDVYFTFASTTQEIDDTPLKIWDFQLVNLTKMFGAGNEPKTVEEYHQRMAVGVDTTVRNTGEILSNKVTAIKSVGENAYDYRVGYAKVLPKTYNFEGTYTSLEFATTHDGTREAIALDENNKYTFEQEGYVFAEGSDICINIQYSYDKEFMHDYQQSVVDLSFIKSIKDSDGNELFLNGLASIPPLRDGNGNIIAETEVYDEIRYNATTKKWEAIKRIGVVDLGTLNWEKYGYTSANTMFVCRTLPNSTGSVRGLSTTYSRYSGALASMSDMSFFMRPNDYPYYLYISDNRYTDATSFKQAVSGEKFLYILTEPIIVELDTNFNPTYLVWDFGTEEAIASVPSAPFRADIVYQFNAVDRIRNNSDRIAELEAQIASLVQAMSAMQTTNLEE